MDVRQAFEGIDRAAIESWIANRQEENLHLEFKTLTGASMKGADDKKSLAKAVSGFANSDGGIIAWGVEAKKSDDGIDCARALVAVSDVQQLISRLNTLTGECVSPIVDGVEHKAIPFHGNGGCVVTYVPKSVRGPYMAKLGEDRYYKRSGDSFYKMEHFDLADMFGSRQRPNLTASLEWEATGNEQTKRLRFFLRNVGTKSARYSGFLVIFSEEISIAAVESPLVSQSHLNNGSKVLSFVDNVGVIHPNNTRINAGSLTFSRDHIDAPLDINLKIYCDEMSAEDHVGKLLSDGKFVYTAVTRALG